MEIFAVLGLYIKEFNVGLSRTERGRLEYRIVVEGMPSMNNPLDSLRLCVYASEESRSDDGIPKLICRLFQRCCDLAEQHLDKHKENGLIV